MRSTPVLALLAALAVPAVADEPPRVVPYQIVNARTIPESLTGSAGDPAAGRALYYDPTIDCARCHGTPGAADAVNAPDLGGLAGRMEIGTARLWIVAPGVLAPETTMPAYYAAGQRTDQADPRFGEPLLSAAELENILAYLIAPPPATGP